MLTNENKTVPAIISQFIANIETLLEKTCSNGEKELPTSTVSPCRALDVNLDTIDFNLNIMTKIESSVIQFTNVIPVNQAIESQIKDVQKEDTIEYCDMV